MLPPDVLEEWAETPEVAPTPARRTHNLRDLTEHHAKTGQSWKIRHRSEVKQSGLLDHTAGRGAKRMYFYLFPNVFYVPPRVF